MTSETATALSHSERRRIVIGVLVAMALATLDQMIVGPAMPVIAMRLGNAEYVSWIVTAYLLTATAVTPLYGKVADLRGRKPALFFAIATFVAGSVVSAIATDMFVLIGGRALQGIGGGGLIAMAQTIIADVVAPKERGRYVAYISAVWAVSSLAGPVLGGVFAEYLHWSLIFWINLPLGVVAFLLSSRALSRMPDVRRDHRLDLPGAVLVIVATVCFLLALTWGSDTNQWFEPLILGLFAAAVLAAFALRWRLARASEPLLPLRVLQHPIVVRATGCNALSTMGMMALAFYTPSYLILVHGLSPRDAGFALVALLAGGVIGANTSGRLMTRVVNYTRLPVLGEAMAAAAVLTLAWRAGSASLIEIEVLLLAIGLGTGPQNPVSVVSVQNAVAPSDLGAATATLAFMRTLGGVIGVALLGAILVAGGAVDGLGAPASVATADVVASYSAAFAVAGGLFILAGLSLALMEQKPLRSYAPADLRAKGGDLPD